MRCILTKRTVQIALYFKITHNPIIFIPKIIHMPKTKLFAALLTLISLTYTLHIHNPALHQQEVNQKLVALRNQQSAFQKEVLGLIDDIKSIQLKVNASTTTNQKVLILETAILSQREKIFKLQNSIIPPFNLSKNACEQLTNQQKIKMLDQLKNAKDEVSKLKAIAAKLPTNVEMVSVNSDIAKQQTVLQGISKVISNQCLTTIIFSPTIYQTNLFAPNWILGKQSIDNIVEQYYQRSRLYHNITNCGLDTPFFDNKICIKCSQPTPVFNMQSSQCQKCPYDTKLNSAKHICEQIPHFTDYKKIDNFILDGGTQPITPTDGTTPCSPNRPYFDGSKCVTCALPSYWNVKQNKCKDCLVGQVFDPNTKNCNTPQGNTLSYLQGNSRWVTSTDNFRNVLKERGELIKNNPTKYTICGKDSPYFDGISCISCPFEFSLADKKCVSGPTDKVFNPNLHQYVTPIAGKQTNPNATNLLSNSPLPATNNPCDMKTPFYDGISCIQCPEPFPLFNITTKKCSSCSPWQLYDNKSLKCIKRPVMMISNNFNNLLGSPKSNLTTYKAQLLDKVKQNGDNIVKQCAADQYSNYTHCFKCLPPNDRFNIQTKKCDTCNGTVDNNTLICDPVKTMLTDLDAKNLIVGSTSNLTAYADAQKKIQGPILKCPPQTPYAVDGSKCIACSGASTPYFDLQSQKCINCPDKLYFNSVSHKCQKEIFITNVTAIKKFIQIKNYTVANVKLQLQNLSKTRKTALCNESTPLATPEGDKCYACETLGYYNLKTKECVPGLYVSNLSQLKANGKVIQSDGRTLQSMAMQSKVITNPQVTCPKQKPFSDGQKCIVCPDGQYYYLSNYSCYQPKLVSNLTALQQLGRIVQVGGATLQAQKDEIKNTTMPVTTCPSEAPLSNGTKCITCPTDKYYDIKNKNCFEPSTVSNIDALKKIGKVIEEGNSTLANLQTNISQTIKPKICAQTTPLFNGTACISCPSDNYYVLINSTCYTPKPATNLAFLTASKNYVQSGGVTLQSIQDNINQYKLPVTICPNQTPLFDGIKCTSCAVEQYYGLQKKICLNVTVVSNTDAITLQNNYIQNGNSTLQKLVIANKKVAQPKRVCPADLPLYNGTNCIACKQSLYNIQSSQCSNCASDFYYDSKTHKCLKKPDYYPNLNNDQWIVSYDAGLTKVGQLLKQRKAINGSVICPQDKPHFNGNTKTCQSCSKDTFWNYQTNVCMSCATGQQVDQNTRKCDKRTVGEYQTSLTSPKLLFDGLPRAQFQDQYDFNKQKYPNIKDCPAEKPYFDGFQCIQCSPSSPLFSMLTKLCSSCPPNSIYDQQNRYCYIGKQLKTTKPTTDKMYSSIF